MSMPPIAADPHRAEATARWPIVLAVAVLVGSLAAVVATLLDANVPEWFTSIWLWGPLLGLTTFALLLSSERSIAAWRRRMRYALVISLLAHLILAIYLKDQFLAFVMAPKALEEPVAVEPLPTLPEYYFRPVQTTETREAFEQPVQTDLPQLAPVLERLEADVDVNVERAPTPRPLPNTTAVPAPIPFERTETSVPRRADEASQLSRADPAQAQLRQSDAEPTRFRQRQPTSRAQPTASPTEVARRAANEPPQRRRANAAPARSLAAAAPPSRQPERQNVARAAAALPEAAPSEFRRQTPSLQASFAEAEPVTAPAPSARTSRTGREAIQLTPSALARTATTSRGRSPARRQAQPTTSSAGTQGEAGSQGVGQASFGRVAAARSDASAGEMTQGTPQARSGGSRTRGEVAMAGDATAQSLGDVGQAEATPGAGRADAGDVAALAPSDGAGELQRSQSSIPVRNRAPRGPGGLGQRPARTAGVPSRRASPSSEVVHTTPSRFLRRRAVGPATLGSRSRTTAEPFARRGMRRTQQASNDPRRPSAATDAAIERGLQYLASIQRPDGRWSLQHMSADPTVADRPARIEADSAATGMALLAFLGAGYDHFGDEYQQEVADGLQFLIQNQKENGDLYIKQPSPASNGVWFYSHGIAAMALCEAYGMTGDAALKVPAQRAIDFIVASQSPDRGGWRYQPRISSDLSVSGWQIMALKSGKLAGLDVPPAVFEKAKGMLDATQASTTGATFVYNPWAAQDEKSRNDRSPSTVMTAVGLLMRLYGGWTRSHPTIQEGAALLQERLASSSQPYEFAGLKNPNRDTYYWYNATQVMFHMQGEHWDQWNRRLYPMLAGTQETEGPLAGSWNPYDPVPDRWGVYAGRVYVTAMNLLSLEVYYRHLPLFDEGLAVQ